MNRILAFAVLVSVICAGSVTAQESMEYEDWMDYNAAYGEVRVVGVAEKTLTVLDENAELDEDAIIKYYVIEDVELEGLDDYREIMVGDMVDVEYYTLANGMRMVDFISVERDEREEVKDILLQLE